MAVYMLDFNTYNGFKDYLENEDEQDGAMLKDCMSMRRI